MQVSDCSQPQAATRLKPNWRQAPWWMKAGAQAALALLPFGEALNHRLQIWNGFDRNFPWAVEANLEHFSTLVTTISRCGAQLHGATAIEVGTGWIPTLALGLHLLGAEVHTYDHVRHLRDAHLTRLLALYPNHLPSLAAAAGCELGLLQARLHDLQRAHAKSAALDSFLPAAGIHYHAPADAASTALPGNSADLYFSVAVFEHVPLPAIKAMLREAYRTLKPGGLTYHVIGLFDHYTTMDSRITRVNFLKYSDFTWRLIGQNRIQFHNRLRESEFLSLFREAGFEIVDRRSEVDQRSLEALETLPIHPRFRAFDRKDLATYGTIITARKPL